MTSIQLYICIHSDSSIHSNKLLKVKVFLTYHGPMFSFNQGYRVTIIIFINAEKLKQLGFPHHDSTNHLMNPVQYFQLTVDVTVDSSTKQENQLPFNRFVRWFPQL